MKALSIRQPYAHMVVHESKRQENRVWLTGFRGPFLVHAAKGMTYEEYDNAVWYVRDHIEGGMSIVERLPHPKKLLKGGIIGVADLVGCWRSPRTLAKCKPFEIPGGHVFELGEVAPLPFAECRGALGLWDVPDDVIAETGLGRLRLHPRDKWAPGAPWTEKPMLKLEGLVETRAPLSGAHHIIEARLTPLGRKVRDALGGATCSNG